MKMYNIQYTVPREDDLVSIQACPTVAEKSD